MKLMRMPVTNRHSMMGKIVMSYSSSGGVAVRHYMEPPIGEANREMY
jgi:hypothetical protein